MVNAAAPFQFNQALINDWEAEGFVRKGTTNHPLDWHVESDTMGDFFSSVGDALIEGILQICYYIKAVFCFLFMIPIWEDRSDVWGTKEITELTILPRLEGREALIESARVVTAFESCRKYLRRFPGSPLIDSPEKILSSSMLRTLKAFDIIHIQPELERSIRDPGAQSEPRYQVFADRCVVQKIFESAVKENPTRVARQIELSAEEPLTATDPRVEEIFRGELAIGRRIPVPVAFHGRRLEYQVVQQYHLRNMEGVTSVQDVDFYKALCHFAAFTKNRESPLGSRSRAAAVVTLGNKSYGIGIVRNAETSEIEEASIFCGNRHTALTGDSYIGRRIWEKDIRGVTDPLKELAAFLGEVSREEYCATYFKITPVVSLQNNRPFPLTAVLDD